MQYTVELFEDTVSRFGEAMVVLDSDREYMIHGTEGFTFRHPDDPSVPTQPDSVVVRAEGIDESEYKVVEFPLDSVEHIYTHKEL